MRSNLLLAIPFLLACMLALPAIPVGSVAQPKGPKPARYHMIDLGTLGGTYSFAYGINSSGMVAGGAATGTQTDSISQTAFLWYGGLPINLGTLGGSACPGCSSQGSAVSANGSVTMISETGSHRSEWGRFLRVRHSSPVPGSRLEKRED